jgi:hypothetical protein
MQSNFNFLIKGRNKILVDLPDEFYLVGPFIINALLLKIQVLVEIAYLKVKNL